PNNFRCLAFKTNTPEVPILEHDITDALRRCVRIAVGDDVRRGHLDFFYYTVLSYFISGLSMERRKLTLIRLAKCSHFACPTRFGFECARFVLDTSRHPSMPLN